jgi:small ligand-binding sensory domain FIST
MIMICAAASASRLPLPELLQATTEQVRAQLGDNRPDLAVVFFTNHFEDEAQEIATTVRLALQQPQLLGCSGEGVIGPEHEHEQEPALALWAARLPKGAKSAVIHADAESLAQAAADQSWADLLQVVPEEPPGSLVLLADPFTADMTTLLAAVNARLRGWTIQGGMVSGAEAPQQAALIANDAVYRDGLVGVALSGGLQVDAVVSQGCRPIGRPYVITKAERNIIYELGGKKPLELLQQIFEQATPADRQLMQRGVLLGRAIKETQPEFRRGDFLIRNLIDADQNSGAIAVGDLVRVGVTVQFQVRDAATADEDLRALVKGRTGAPPAGALLFSCNGRGRRLFVGQKDHDVSVIREWLPGLPIAGFFCAGELGPIGGSNFIHGHTASIAFLRPRIP